MSSSIGRPRSRPRVDSLSWQSFFWLLRREAALRVVFPYSIDSPTERAARVAVAQASSRDCTHTALMMIRRDDKRRWFSTSAAEAAEPCIGWLGAEPLDEVDLARRAHRWTRMVVDSWHGPPPRDEASPTVVNRLPTLFDSH